MANGKILVALAMACALIQFASAAEFTVGDGNGWGFSDYTSWPAGKTFRVGDTLRFNFASGAHDVMEVSQSNFDSCTATPITDYGAQGPVTVPLNTTGNHYFICSIPSHCTPTRMRVTVNVVAGQQTPSTPTTPSTPSTPSGSPPRVAQGPSPNLVPGGQAPPPPNAASGLAIGGWVAAAASVAAGLVLAA